VFLAREPVLWAHFNAHRRYVGKIDCLTRLSSASPEDCLQWVDLLFHADGRIEYVEHFTQFPETRIKINGKIVQQS
jgi:hypothetical protein